ncbi:hypothetical protein Peur_052124 [Populus x canadensis]
MAFSFATPHATPSPLQDFCMAINDANYAISFAALTSQDPGVNPVANAVFGASWPIYPEVLTTALQMDKRFVEDLQLKTGSIPLLGPLKASHAQHVKCNVTG